MLEGGNYIVCRNNKVSQDSFRLSSQNVHVSLFLYINTYSVSVATVMVTRTSLFMLTQQYMTAAVLHA